MQRGGSVGKSEKGGWKNWCKESSEDNILEMWSAGDTPVRGVGPPVNHKDGVHRVQQRAKVKGAVEKHDKW